MYLLGPHGRLISIYKVVTIVLDIQTTDIDLVINIRPQQIRMTRPEKGLELGLIEAMWSGSNIT
jgi:hypothetical protein